MKTEYLLARDMEHVLAALTPANQLVCRVCLHTGLRLGDVLALRTDQIKRQGWITERKTGKKRQIGLPDALISAVRAQAGPIWAFPGRLDAKKHRTRQSVWKDVKRASRAFRLPQNVAPHSLRKMYAVELLSKYGDVERVKRALNHSDVTTTMLYAMADKLLTARPARRRKKKKTP